MAQDSKSRKLDQYIVRFPDGMRDRLKDEAENNNRSLNAEIVARLERYDDLPKIVRDYERAEQDLYKEQAKVRGLQIELEAAQAALADQKNVTAMLRQLLKENLDEAKQDQEERAAANRLIAEKYGDLIEQRKLLEALKEELAHLSHARGDSEGETARLARQQADSFERLEKRIEHLTKGLVVYGRAFELSTDGDQKRAMDILDKAIDEVEAQGRDVDAPADKKAG